MRVFQGPQAFRQSVNFLTSTDEPRLKDWGVELMSAVGLDIGYSNLCVVHGSEGKPATKILPAGAGPVTMLPENIGGGRIDSGVLITVDGEEWAGGVEPDSLQGWSRELHEDYPSTRTYRALFLAALSVCGLSRVSHLVTGLPTSHYLDEKRRKALTDRLTGAHEIAPGKRVTVDKVTVIAQPAGAYMDFVSQTKDLDIIQEGRVLIIDPGFYSVDWVTVDQGKLRPGSSGSSFSAMSVLLEEVSRLIKDDKGANIEPDRIELALRNGRQTMYVSSERTDLTPYIRQAQETVTRHVMTDLKRSSRLATNAVDLILMAGGGASIYAPAAKEAFPNAQLVELKDPVMANARGFWQIAL
jgi:plasmid segregation protein ParM